MVACFLVDKNEFHCEKLSVNLYEKNKFKEEVNEQIRKPIVNR